MYASRLRSSSLAWSSAARTCSFTICRWSLSRRISILWISTSAREMRVAKRFITFCRARIFLVCARYLSLAS